MRKSIRLRDIAIGQWFLHCGRKMQMVSKPSKAGDGYIAIDMLGVGVTLFYPGEARVVAEEGE